MTQEDGQGRGRSTGGLGPLFSGLIAATLIALTLLAAVALGMGEQDLIARVEPTGTETATLPPATVTPSATFTSVPSTVAPSPTVSPTLSPTATPTTKFTPSPSFTPTNTRMPTRTPVPTQPCRENPWGWKYTWVVRRGETLFGIADEVDSTVQELMRANCLTSTVIHVGQELWVPNPRSTAVPVPTRTSTPTSTPDGPTDTPTATSTPGGPTDTAEPPTDTPEPPTDTPEPPTDTPVPPTDTPEPPTDTPEPQGSRMRGIELSLRATPAGAIAALPFMQERSLAM